MLYYSILSVDFSASSESKSKFILQVGLIFRPVYNDKKNVDYDLTKEYVAGKRLISDVSQPDYVNGNITFVYTGGKCGIFTC